MSKKFFWKQVLSCVSSVVNSVFLFSDCNQMGRRFLPQFRKYLCKSSFKCAIKITLNDVEFYSRMNLS